MSTRAPAQIQSFWRIKRKEWTYLLFRNSDVFRKKNGGVWLSLFRRQTY
jgi:hypothetical protein